MCYRRNAIRDCIERQDSDREFVKTVMSEDEKVNAVREQWLRESNNKETGK